MKLYYLPGASSLAAHIVLEWTGSAYEAVRMDRQALRSPEYLALNPAGTVPLLQHGDLALSESVAILGYIADLHPHLQLLGGGTARSRASTMRWLAFLNSDVNGAFAPIFAPGRYLHGEAHAQAISEAAREQVRDRLRHVDAQLQGRTWLTGTRSVADAYLFVMLRWAMSTRIGLRQFGNLAGFVRRMHGDEGVHAALVLEERLAPRGLDTYVPGDALRRLHRRLRDEGSATVSAEVVGTVEYRAGDGMAIEMRRGIVHAEVSPLDTVLSWVDEKYRGEAALPHAVFSHYVAEGAIRLLL